MIFMGENKQAKVLNKSQVDVVSRFLCGGRNGMRNNLIFLLSVKSGLRAKEIASLQWKMVVNADGLIGDFINLPNSASKGKSGRTIPLNKEVRKSLEEWFLVSKQFKSFDIDSSCVVRTERSSSTSPQAIVNMFRNWYQKLGLVGCSSHSGRRTFITNCSRKISTVGGSLRDVQYLVGHSSLQTTQRYIEGDSESKRKVVELI